MEHPSHTAPAAKTGNIVSPVAGGLAGASIGLGFFSSIVFWWYPFGPILARSRPNQYRASGRGRAFTARIASSGVS